MDLAEPLLEKLRDRSAVIGVIGLGYVGLPLALRYAEANYRVLGFDVDPAKPQKLAAGKSYFQHIPEARVRGARMRSRMAGKRLAAASSLSMASSQRRWESRARASS